MSLLLDALKKAALEKQRREQPNSAKAPAPEPQALTEPVIPPPSVEQQDEGLLFDFSEIDPQYLLPPESVQEPASPAVDVVIEAELVGTEQSLVKEEASIGADESIVDELVRKANTLAAPVNSSPLSMASIPDPKIEISAQATSSEEVKTGLPDSTITTLSARSVDVPNTSAPILVATDEVETFNAASGKAALAQLLERSKKAADSARKRMVLMYGFLSVVAIVLVVCYYYLLHSSSTLVAALPPATPAPEIPVTSEIAEATGATEEDASVVPSITDDVGTAEASLVVEENNLSPQAEQNTWPEDRAEKNNVPQRAARKQPQPTTDDYSTNSVSLPPERVVKQAMIVEHNAAENAVSEAIARGYKAYQADDLEGAGAAYREALEQDPYQRDALLGAAAVAVREGRQQDALTLYQKRLARDPKDEYAQAGILALSSSAEQNPQLESELNRLLQEYPDAAHLHFLKGSLYAARQQWAAAQLAFFEAWQRDNKNPDLAFNLAVALDHLSQPKEAVRFYRQAIELGNRRPVGFSVDAILRRLQTLEQQHVHEGATP